MRRLELSEFRPNSAGVWAMGTSPELLLGAPDAAALERGSRVLADLDELGAAALRFAGVAIGDEVPRVVLAAGIDCWPAEAADQCYVLLQGERADKYHAVVFTMIDGRWEPTAMQRLPFMGERAGWPA